MTDQPHTHSDGTTHSHDGQVSQPRQAPQVSSEKVIHRMALAHAQDRANIITQLTILQEQNEALLAERETLISELKEQAERNEVLTMERDMLRANSTAAAE